MSSDSFIAEPVFRKKFDNFNSPIELAENIQNGIDRIIKDCPKTEWGEDFLSLQLVGTIRDVLSEYTIPNIDNKLNLSKFDLEAYKLTGKAEQAHGDIAVVVTRSFSYCNEPISGVGFYEAKASSLENDDFPAFKIQQLRRLVTGTPRLSYLLYNREPQFSDSQEWPTFFREEHADRKKVYAQTVDANFLKKCRNIREAVHLMGQSFGYHFINKILSGRELDYSRPPIETIRRWLKVTRRTKAFVVSIAIQDENSTKPSSAQLQLPGLENIKLAVSYENGISRLPYKE